MSQISVKNMQVMGKTGCWAKQEEASYGILVSGFRNDDFPVCQMT